MRTVREHLDASQQAFAQHPFFAELERERPLAERLSFVPKLTFWVLAFQDVLRLNEARVQDPAMRRIARHHLKEDSGHDRWFLQDLAALGQREPRLTELFGPAHAAVRDASFALMSEVYRAADDRERVLLLFALEATGHVFFERVSVPVARLGKDLGLKYFSDYHLEVEKAHAVFEGQVEDRFFSQPLTDAERASALALLERCFAAFTAMFDALTRELQAPGEAAPAPLPAPLRLVGGR